MISIPVQFVIAGPDGQETRVTLTATSGLEGGEPDQYLIDETPVSAEFFDRALRLLELSTR